MDKITLNDKIKRLTKDVWSTKFKIDDSALAYDELTNFPELKQVIVDLLTPDFAKFLESIDWVAPRPSTFRINLLNGQSFLLSYNERSWIAEVEGKRYYLTNLDEEERAALSISRILQYGAKEDTSPTGVESDGEEEDIPIEDPQDDELDI